MIRWFQWTQAGAPQICGQAGALIAVLNACLVNGFNLKTATSIIRDGTTATAQFDAGHGMREGTVVRLAGANETAYSGDFVIRNVTTNTFQFDVPASAPTPATGTITAKVAPLDWESPYSATNKAVYRSKDVTGNRLYLRIDETPLPGDTNYGRGQKTAVAQMFESMTDVDTGSGSSQTWWRKGQNDNATPRPWLLIGDSKRLWLLVNWSESYPGRFAPYFFGDFPSFKPGDAYNTMIAGYYDLGYNWNEPNSNSVLDFSYSTGTGVGSTGIWIARSYTQLGGRVNALYVCGLGAAGAGGIGATGLPYPNPADNGIYVAPMMVQEQIGPTLRGRLPGMLCPLHSIPAPDPWVYEGFVIDGTLRKLLVVGGMAGSGAARLAFDLTGPWD